MPTRIWIALLILVGSLTQGCKTKKTVTRSRKVTADSGVVKFAAISNQTVTAGTPIESIQVTKSKTTVELSCFYDATADGKVGNNNKCNSLAGLEFNVTTGIFTWDTEESHLGTYEFKVVENSHGSPKGVIFVVTVTAAEGKATFEFLNLKADTDITQGDSFELLYSTDDGDLDGDVSAVLYRSTSTANCTDGSLLGWTALSGTLLEGSNQTFNLNTTNLSGNQYFCAKVNEGKQTSTFVLSAALVVKDPPASALAESLRGSPQRKIIFDTINGRHWAFYQSELSQIAYANSSDAQHWVNKGVLTSDSRDFHVFFRAIDGAAYVYLTVQANNYDVLLLRGSLSKNGINFETALTVLDGISTANMYEQPTIVADSSDHLWVSATHIVGLSKEVVVRRSTNLGNASLAEWDSAEVVDQRSSQNKQSLLLSQASDNMVLVVSVAGRISCYIYNAAGSSWSSAVSGGDFDWLALNEKTTMSNGVVYAVAVVNSDIYFGGSFTNVAGIANADYIVRWDGRDFHAVGSGTNGTVRALFASGTELFIGGSFTVAGGVAANRIARWDGAGFSALDTGTDGTVYALSSDGTSLYLGGSFTTAGGVSTANIAKWNGSTFVSLSSGANGTVNAIYSDGTSIYFGGAFSSIGGVSTNALAKWDGSAFSAVGNGIVSGTVYTIEKWINDLYIGGNFLTTTGESHLAKWNGTTFSAVGTGSDLPVYGITASDNAIYITGAFSTISGQSAARVAKWNGSTMSAMSSGLSDTGFAVAVNGNSVVVGGQFSIAGGVSARAAVSWDGSAFQGFGTADNGAVNSIAVLGSNLYVGGTFTTIGGVSANRIAKWDGTGFAPLGSGMNERVTSLVTYGSELYVAGWFTTAGGVAANYLAKWNGSSFSAVGSGLDAPVHALFRSGSDLYIGGEFANAGGSSASRIAKLNLTTSSYSALGAGTNGTVECFAMLGSTLYLGGSFTTAGGGSANRVAKWDGSAFTALSSGLDGVVYALTASSSEVYVGGSFTTAGGVSAANIAMWDGTNFNALGSGLDAAATSLSYFSGAVVVGGGFSSANGSAISNLAKWDGAAFSAVGSGIYNSIGSILVSGSTIYAAGDANFIALYDRAVLRDATSFSATVDVNDRIHLIAASGSANLIYKLYNGASWNAATTIASHASYPLFSYDHDNDNVFLTYKSDGGLSYQVLAASAWSSAFSITSSDVSLPSCAANPGFGKVACWWSKLNLESLSTFGYAVLEY